LSEVEQTSQTAPTPESEAVKPKCVKCGKEFDFSWYLTKTDEGLICDRCLKYRCVKCRKEVSKASGAHEGFTCKDCQEKERLEKLRLNAVANFTFENAQLFEKILKAVSACQDEALFNIENEGITIRVMDPSRVAMVDYYLSKRAFVEYRVHTEGFMLIDLEEVLKQMKHLRKDTSIKALVDGKDAKLILTLVDTRERERKLPMLEVDSPEVLPSPKVSYTAKVKVNASEFYTDLEDVGNVSDHVSFEAYPQSFIMNVGGDYTSGKNKYEVGETDSVLLECEGNGDNRTIFSLNYLKAMIRKDLSETVVFEWSKEMPLRITHENVLEDSKIMAYVAPRIEVE